jgi:N utilization substance protein B
MGTRRKARELAMQALFFMDSHRDFSVKTFDRFCANFSPKPDERLFFSRLVEGVVNARERLDNLIERFSENWTLDRMSCVDRNVMRIAVYELMCCRDIPAKVSINEAVDIGKKFGTEDSGAFINGIVDSIRAAVERGELEQPCREYDPEGSGAQSAFHLAPDPPDGSEEGPAAREPLPAKPRRKKARSTTPLVKRKRKTELPPEE